MKSLARVAVVGFTGVVLFKVGTALLSPLVGMLLGLIFLTVKLALAAAVLYFLYSLVRPRDDDGNEVEIEVEDIVQEAEVIIEDVVDAVDDIVDDVVDGVEDAMDGE